MSSTDLFLSATRFCCCDRTRCRKDSVDSFVANARLVSWTECVLSLSKVHERAVTGAQMSADMGSVLDFLVSAISSQVRVGSVDSKAEHRARELLKDRTHLSERWRKLAADSAELMLTPSAAAEDVMNQHFNQLSGLSDQLLNEQNRFLSELPLARL